MSGGFLRAEIAWGITTPRFQYFLNCNGDYKAVPEASYCGFTAHAYCVPRVCTCT